MENSRKEKLGFLGLLQDRKWYLLILTVFWILILLIRNPFDSSKGFIQVDQSTCLETAELLAGMTDGVLVEQRFTAEHNNLKAIAYTTATADRKNIGTLTIRVMDAETGELIIEDVQDVSELPNVELMELEFPEIPDSKGREYQVSLQADCPDAEKCIILMGGEPEKMGPAYINGEESPLALRMTATYHDLQYFWYRILVFLLVYLIAILLVLLVRGTDARSYLILALSLGIMFLVIMPFPHVWDESTHFFRSFMISEGNFVDDINEDGKIGGYISETYRSVIDEKLNWESYLNDSDDWLQVFSDEAAFYTNPYMSSYIPLNHLPGAVGLWIGRLLNLQAIWCILLGRFITLLCYIAMTYIAIRKADYYRNVFFVVAGLPLSLFLAASFSADPLLVGASLMVISICLKYRFNSDQMIQTHELLLLLVGVTLVASSKYLIYVPILLLFFLIPRKCFSGRKQYILEIVLAVIIMIVLATMAFWLLKQFNYVEDRNGHVDMGEQVQFLLNNKLTGLGYLAYSFFENLNSNLMELGRQTENLAITALCVLVAVLENRPFEFENSKAKVKLCVLFTAIIFIVHACTVGALYLGFTPVGKARADGVQPRYILPLVPLIMITFGNCISAETKVRNLDSKVAFSLLLIGLGILSLFMMQTFV